MKKFIYLIITVSFFAVSCSLEEIEKDKLLTHEAIEDVADANNVANGLYLSLRGLTSGSYIYSPEISCDFFHACVSYGNRNGEFYKWEWTASNDVATSLWDDAYYTINDANFLLQGISAIDKTGLKDADLAALSKDAGVAYFMKAYAAFELLEYFCKPYSTANASELGIMIDDEYVTSVTGLDQSKLPGRSTLDASYKWVLNNLNLAAASLASVSGAVGSTTVTKDAVTALKARVALAMQNYADAATMASSLVDPGLYPLNTTQEQWSALWTNDSGTECIMQLYANYGQSSVPASLDPGYTSYSASSGLYTPDYILAKWVINEYSSKDLRFNTWFTKQLCTYGTTAYAEVYLLDKFPGNKTLQSSSSSTSQHIQKIKPFRIAEQYLIAAEAYAMSKDYTNANKYLKMLLASRIPGVNYTDLTGNELVQTIRMERTKEFIGEGFRFFDLKRWGQDIKRTAAQSTDIIFSAGADNTEFLTKNANDHRWLWPIPQSELDANKQISGQQNPGY